MPPTPPTLRHILPLFDPMVTAYGALDYVVDQMFDEIFWNWSRGPPLTINAAFDPRPSASLTTLSFASSFDQVLVKPSGPYGAFDHWVVLSDRILTPPDFLPPLPADGGAGVGSPISASIFSQALGSGGGAQTPGQTGPDVPPATDGAGAGPGGAAAALLAAAAAAGVLDPSLTVTAVCVCVCV